MTVSVSVVLLYCRVIEVDCATRRQHDRGVLSYICFVGSNHNLHDIVAAMASFNHHITSIRIIVFATNDFVGCEFVENSMSQRIGHPYLTRIRAPRSINKITCIVNE